MWVLSLAKWPSAGKDKGLLGALTGAEGTIWTWWYLHCSGALKPHQTFHMLQQHTSSSSRVVSKTGTHKSAHGHNMGPVVTSTLRELRAGMVRSQLIKVTNSTQMQEHLLTEPDTCPCRHSLLSPTGWQRTAVLAPWDRDRWWPRQPEHEPSSAWGHLHPPVQGRSCVLQRQRLSSIMAKKGNKTKLPFLISTISWSLLI